MRRVQEYTNLAKVRVFYDGKEAYTFNFDKGYKLPNPYVFRGDHDSFVRFLMGIKAKDNKTWPRSVRGERYSDIADEIESGSDQIIYVWEHDFMRYINKKKEDNFRESIIGVDDLYRNLDDKPGWEVYDSRPDLLSYTYKGKLFIDFDLDEEGVPYNVKVGMSNNVGDLDVDFYYDGVRKVEIDSKLITFTLRTGDEVNIFLR